MLPRSLRLSLCYDPAEAPRCHGPFSDTWKGEYSGRDVAAKVLRVSSKYDLGRLERVGPLPFIVVRRLDPIPYRGSVGRP